jgi:hypothetical protein
MILLYNDSRSRAASPNRFALFHCARAEVNDEMIIIHGNDTEIFATARTRARALYGASITAWSSARALLLSLSASLDCRYLPLVNLLPLGKTRICAKVCTERHTLAMRAHGALMLHINECIFLEVVNAAVCVKMNESLQE